MRAKRSEWEKQRVAALPQERHLEAYVERLLESGTRIIAGPWLGELGWEVLYWLPLLRWCVGRWPELKGRAVAVSRGGVADWYERIADTYVDVFEAYDETSFVRRLAEERESRVARGLNRLKQVDEESAWEGEIATWVSERLGEPLLPMLHPSVLFRSKKLVLQLPQTEESGFTRWPTPDRGHLSGILPERYVAVRFYTSSIFKGKEAREFAMAAVRALAERTRVVWLYPGMDTDPQHPDLIPDFEVVSLAAHTSFRDNLATQSIAIANATAFVGNFGGLSFVGPHYGVPSYAFWTTDRGNPRGSGKGMWRDLDLAVKMFDRPEGGSLTARWCGERPVEDLLASVPID